MLAECPWCKKLFDAPRPGRQTCPSCGAEIELPEPMQQAPPQREQAPPQQEQPPQRQAQEQRPYGAPSQGHAPEGQASFGQRPSGQPPQGHPEQAEQAAPPWRGGAQPPPSAPPQGHARDGRAPFGQRPYGQSPQRHPERPGQAAAPPWGGGAQPPPSPPPYGQAPSEQQPFAHRPAGQPPYGQPPAGLPPYGGQWSPEPWAAGTEAFEPAPWERLDELGFWRAFSDTWKATCFDPSGFFSRLAPWRLGPAFFYALLVGAIGSVGNSLWTATIFNPLTGGSSGFLVFELFGALVGQAVGIWIAAGIVHLGCLLFGAASQGFGATFRVVAYASSPAILGILPMGSLVGGIWSLVLAIVGLQWMQRTTRLRAVLAVLLIPGVFLAGLIFLVMSAVLIGFGGLLAT